jgi:hypothetical protein
MMCHTFTMAVLRSSIGDKHNHSMYIVFLLVVLRVVLVILVLILYY